MDQRMWTYSWEFFLNNVGLREKKHAQSYGLEQKVGKHVTFLINYIKNASKLLHLDYFGNSPYQCDYRGFIEFPNL